MLFFNNPRRKVRRSKSKKRRSGKRARKMRVRVVRRVARSISGGSMARKRGRGRGARRRRRSSGKTPAVALRRRGVTVYRSNPRRRRRGGFRSNPGGNLVTTIKQGVKDGAVILVSQIATKRAIGLSSRFVPVQGIAGAAISGLGVPIVITLVARKVAPNLARLASAAAFAEGVRHVLSQTPVGGLLADVVDANDQSEEYSAWPAPQIPANMGAYPGMVGDYDEQYVQ